MTTYNSNYPDVSSASSEPLLADGLDRSRGATTITYETQGDNTQDPTPEATIRTNDVEESSPPPPPPPPPNSLLLGCCTLAVVLTGLALVSIIASLPLLLGILLQKTKALPVTVISDWQYTYMCMYWFSLAVLNFVHCFGLWKSAYYLAVFRFLVLPIRRLVLPIVMAIARIESIREQEPVLYYKVVSEDSTSSNPVLFRKSVRRHYRRMQKIYQRHNLQHKCFLSEYHLNLSQVMPVLWEHERRVCAAANKNPLQDFIQRALVVSVVPGGILDFYFSDDNNSNDNHQLVSFQFSICQGRVWHWFMYFCRDDHQKSGIWWHGALLAIHRGHANTTQIDYVNAQQHQTESKVHAGYSTAHQEQHACANNNRETISLSELYPMEFTRTIPQEAIDVRLWD